MFNFFEMNLFYLLKITKNEVSFKKKKLYLEFVIGFTPYFTIFFQCTISKKLIIF